MAGKRSGFGSVRRLPSRRWQARYTAPGGKAVSAPMTFDTKSDATTWLDTIHTDLVRGNWLPPDNATTFGDYSTTWLRHRTLKPRTREHYRMLLDQHILPSFASVPVWRLTPASVREWHAKTALSTPTIRAHAYALLKTICATAVTDDLLSANPCRIRGAAQANRVVKIKPATLDDLEKLVAAMPEKYRVLTLLAAWCGLRFGELTELRRKDVDTKTGVIRIRRAVAWVDSKPLIGKPKSDAGTRDVAIPPHLLPAIKAHVTEHAQWGPDGLVFPSPQGTNLTTSTLYASFWPARQKAGRPDLRWHDLRHTGAVLAASTGATLAELMARLGHSTPAAALRYQHAAEGRDAQIAALLSDLARR